MRLSNLILADFNALLRRSRFPSCLPRLLETHTEHGFLLVSLSPSSPLPLFATLSPPLPPPPAPPPSPWAMWLTHTEFGFSLCPSATPTLPVETHTEYGFLFVSLSHSP